MGSNDLKRAGSGGFASAQLAAGSHMNPKTFTAKARRRQGNAKERQKGLSFAKFLRLGALAVDCSILQPAADVRAIALAKG
jgi:hypothetical protein